ncbi:MAG TPA: ABC transporter ATP-binding protein [Spirochaetes bacterium]|nr:ABC transporter ATP-binding protein [Spirochaetota bacterium]
MKEENLLIDVRDLRVYFHIEQGIVRAVDGLSFKIEKGQSIGIVGESGCGKTVTALSLMLLHPQPEGEIESGNIYYYPDGDRCIDIAKLGIYSRQIRNIRGNEIAMIFQEPMMSLNPVYKVGQQIMEAIRLHQKVDKTTAKELAIESLRRVKISAPERRINEYPFQLSGGMRQRVMIAIALSCNPNLLIADEPTTALDVTIEAEILKLIKDLQRELGTSLMMITHDLGVIGEVTDEVVVMYVGKIVEKAKTGKLFEKPLHPYTKALFKSRPEIRMTGRLSSIKGSVPNPYQLPEGCSFEPRCDEAMDICRKKAPDLYDLDGHCVSCWKFNLKEG